MLLTTNMLNMNNPGRVLSFLPYIVKANNCIFCLILGGRLRREDHNSNKNTLTKPKQGNTLCSVHVFQINNVSQDCLEYLLGNIAFL
jgi:hypothetical protein